MFILSITMACLYHLHWSGAYPEATGRRELLLLRRAVLDGGGRRAALHLGEGATAIGLGPRVRIEPGRRSRVARGRRRARQRPLQVPPIRLRPRQARQGQRVHLRTQLIYRRKRANNPLYPGYEALSSRANDIANQPAGGTLTLPSDRWFARFEKRHAAVLGTGAATEVSADRAATYGAGKLAEDMLLLKNQLVEAGLMGEAGGWLYTPGEEYDDAPGRGRGHTARCKFFQMDEKGEFLHYDAIKGKLKRVK